MKGNGLKKTATQINAIDPYAHIRQVKEAYSKEKTQKQWH